MNKNANDIGRDSPIGSGGMSLSAPVSVQPQLSLSPHSGLRPGTRSSRWQWGSAEPQKKLYLSSGHIRKQNTTSSDIIPQKPPRLCPVFRKSSH